MKVYQSRSFAKKVKRISKNEKSALDNEIREIIYNPTISEKKKDALKEIFLRKFNFQITQQLLAYNFAPEDESELSCLFR